MNQYTGIVLLLSAIVNAALLLGTVWICGYPPDKRRIICGTAVAGGYAALCLRFPQWGGSVCHLVSIILVGWIAFGVKPKKIAVYGLLVMAVEGLAPCLGGGTAISAVPAAVLILSLCAIAFVNHKTGTRFVPVELNFRGKRLKLTALRDTGNTLYDPVTGCPVLVVDPLVAVELTGLNRQQLQTPVEVMRQPPLPGLRLIPYRSIGQSAGMLLAIRIPQVQVGSWQGCLMVAFAPEEFSSKGEFQALTGGTI